MERTAVAARAAHRSDAGVELRGPGLCKYDRRKLARLGRRLGVVAKRPLSCVIMATIGMTTLMAW